MGERNARDSVCVCVRERERETDRERDRETERVLVPSREKE